MEQGRGRRRGRLLRRRRGPDYCGDIPRQASGEANNGCLCSEPAVDRVGYSQSTLHFTLALVGCHVLRVLTRRCCQSTARLLPINFAPNPCKSSDNWSCNPTPRRAALVQTPVKAVKAIHNQHELIKPSPMPCMKLSDQTTASSLTYLVSVDNLPMLQLLSLVTQPSSISDTCLTNGLGTDIIRRLAVQAARPNNDPRIVANIILFSEKGWSDCPCTRAKVEVGRGK